VRAGAEARAWWAYAAQAAAAEWGGRRMALGAELLRVRREVRVRVRFRVSVRV